MLCYIYASIVSIMTPTVQSYTFALVTKRLDSIFFDAVREGCEAAASRMDQNVTCLYTGPPTRDDSLSRYAVRNCAKPFATNRRTRHCHY